MVRNLDLQSLNVRRIENVDDIDQLPDADLPSLEQIRAPLMTEYRQESNCANCPTRGPLVARPDGTLTRCSRTRFDFNFFYFESGTFFFNKKNK